MDYALKEIRRSCNRVQLSPTVNFVFCTPKRNTVTEYKVAQCDDGTIQDKA